jgi:hypothetical protein
MKGLRCRYGYHRHNDEDHCKDDGEAKESSLDSSPGAIDCVRLSENATQAAALHLK